MNAAQPGQGYEMELNGLRSDTGLYVRVMAKMLDSNIVKLVLPAAVLAWVWGLTLNHLRVEWTLNEQYTYGWAVPFLMCFMVWRRCCAPEARAADSQNSSPSTSTGSEGRRPWRSASVACLALLACAPVRLIGEANPEWRLVSWALALVAVSLTLSMVALADGGHCWKRLAFPVGFFLVAVPWPTMLEQLVIQGLTRLNASASVELLGLLGVPALRRGNVIEIGSGVLGIDEACSGIRSVQAALMLALFFGEYHRMAAARRFGLCAVGLGLSLVFNLARTTLLVMVAARWGMDSVAQWHDPAGVTILVGCFTGLWLVALWWNRRDPLRNTNITERPAQGLRIAEQLPRWLAGSLAKRLAQLSLCFIAWLAVSEVGIEYWYLTHEKLLPSARAWTVVFPKDQPAYAERALPARTRQLLRFDAAQNAFWRDKNESLWQGTFLRWQPGRTATHLARSHTPEVCLAAAGSRVVAVSDLKWINVQGFELPVRFYQIEQAGRMVNVLYCLWSDRASRQDVRTLSLDYGVRLGSVFAGLRLQGQRSLQLAVWGAASAAEAEAALLQQFSEMVKASPSGPSARPESRHESPP